MESRLFLSFLPASLAMNAHSGQRQHLNTLPNFKPCCPLRFCLQAAH